ncbi:MAG: hypothetical protein GXO01_01155 [Epsilonproteobacteria bacterium]|nr:hypothetical protein [Campylobacterota bacterium]
MRAVLIVIAVLFLGCSSKTVEVEILQKPKILTKEVRKIKIDNLKNDKIGLKEAIVEKMIEKNQEIPYFVINPKDWESKLTGSVKHSLSEKTYFKRVKIRYEKPRCLYKLYPCKVINGAYFCKNTPATSLTQSAYDKIKKQAYKNSNYILYKNSVFKVVKNCKPLYKTVKCKKQHISINADIKVLNRNSKTIFQNIYSQNLNEDSCKNVKYYEGIKEYTLPSLKTQLEIQKNVLAEKIVNDLAPHYVKAEFELKDEPDVKLSSEDKELFEKAIDEDTPTYESVAILSRLFNKYPNSCTIRYDLALFLTKQKKYQEALNIIRICNDKDSNKLKSYLYNSFK